MKRDFLAAFTFILSGILFYSIGQEADAKDLGSGPMGCDEGQAVVVIGDSGIEIPAEISFLEDGRLDS